MIREFYPHLYHHQKVRVYRNLNNGLVSVQYKGKVVGHTDNLAITLVRFIVSELARIKMVAAKRRAVHAYAEGILLLTSPDISLTHTLHYNPYCSGQFCLKPGEKKVTEADYVVVKDNVVYVVTSSTFESEQLSLF